MGREHGVLYAHRILLVSGTNNACWLRKPRERRCQKHTARPGGTVFNLLVTIRVTIGEAVRRLQLEKAPQVLSMPMTKH